MARHMLNRLALGVLLTILPALDCEPGTGSARAEDLWPLARDAQAVHRFSTLITAHNVRDLLSTEEGLNSAIKWCQQTGVTKIYLETFRSDYTARAEALIRARDQFRAAGIEVSGCVTTTNVGKQSTGWNLISCYTHPPTQATLQKVFEFTASLFDEIMIDDFWFTDCECPDCLAARQARTVTIQGETYPVTGDSWEDYRCELLVQLSRHAILAPARRVNPRVKVIIKYPQWYDQFHNRGYEVLRETEDFDRIWVGTEVRDYDDKEWGGTPPYEAYFIMRWLGGIGAEKCGGGWFDPYGTTEKTYVEQARQTILGGARESTLFCYGSLLEGTGPRNVEVLREHIPELLQVAKQVRQCQIVGVAAYKPANSHAENEPRVFDFIGMLGIPLVPCHTFPTDAPAGFFSVHALKDPQLIDQLSAFIAAGKPTLLTDGLAKRLQSKMNLQRDNVIIVPVNGEPKSLLELPQTELDKWRRVLLAPLSVQFQAPNRIGLYLFSDGSWVVENFRDEPVTVQLNGQSLEIGPRDWKSDWRM